MRTSGELGIGDQLFDLDGSLTGSALAYVRLAVHRGNGVEVTVEQLDIGIESLEATFADAEVDALFGLTEGFLRTTLEDQVRAALSGVVAGTVPDLLASVLGNLDTAFAGTKLSFDRAPLDPVVLTLDGRLGALALEHRKSVLAPIDMALSCDAAHLHPGSRGVARLVAGEEAPQYFEEGQVQVGLHLAFVNGLLHVAWSCGLLDMDLKPLLPDLGDFVQDAKIRAQLAPIVRPPREGEDHDLMLSLGQLELEIVSQGVPARFGIALKTGADLTLVGGKVAIDLSASPVVHAWPLAPSDSAINARVIEQLFPSLWGSLRTSLGSALSIAIRIAPVGGLTFQLDETDPRLWSRGELLLIDAALTGTAPAP